MELTIITVNFRCWDHLRAALDGLSPATQLHEGRWEIIVVDNASGGDELEQFRKRYDTVRFLENAGNLGFASANNLGARNAAGEYLLFMNPDVVVDPTQVDALLREKKAHPEIALLTAPQFDGRGRLQKSFDQFPDLLTYFRSVRSLMRKLLPGRNPDPRRLHDEIVHCDWISGSLLMLSREDFEHLGGWSEDYWMYAEDIDLCRRAADLGLARALTPAAQFTHLHGGASRRDPAVTLITKSEVMISAHVYIQRHFTGIHRVANHVIVGLRNLGPLTVAGLVNLLTLGRLPGIRLRSRLLGILLRHYTRVIATGNWVSQRAPNYPG
jgi:GT2 family glycosyltransferase